MPIFALPVLAYWGFVAANAARVGVGVGVGAAAYLGATAEAEEDKNTVSARHKLLMDRLDEALSRIVGRMDDIGAGWSVDEEKIRSSAKAIVALNEAMPIGSERGPYIIALRGIGDDLRCNDAAAKWDQTRPEDPLVAWLNEALAILLDLYAALEN